MWANRLHRGAFVLLVIFTIGWYWLPSTKAQASTVHNTLFFLAAMPVLWGLFLLKPRKSLLGTPLALASGALIASLAATGLWAQEPVESTVVTVIIHAIATATFVFGVAWTFDAARLHVFRIAVAAGATSIAVVSIAAWHFGRTYNPGRLHSAFHFEHPNLFAQYLGLAALLTLGSVLRARKNRPWLVWSAALCVLGCAIVLTRGRAVILAFVIAGLLSVALHRKKQVFAGILVIVIVISAIALTGETTFVDFVKRGDAGRVHIWKTLLARVGDRPMIGAGINADDNVTFPKGSGDFPDGFTLEHPHSMVIGTLFYGGLTGLALLLLVIILGLRAGRRNGLVDGEWDPLILLVFGVICLTLDGHRLISEPHLSSWLLFWLPIGLIAAGPLGARKTQPSEPPLSDRPTIESPGKRPAPALGGPLLFLLILVALLLRAPHMGEAIDSPHTWRQCDTAQYIHAFYTDGIDVLHPSVCWMGDHRTVVLEFPLHEAVAAGAYHLFGPSHVTARWVTLFFFMGSTLFFYMFVRSIADGSIAGLATVISMILPLALFYSRAIHIDYAALFFVHAMAWLWSEAIKRNSPRLLWLGSVPAALALIIKAPYVLPFVPVLIWMTFTHRRWALVLKGAPALIAPAAIFAAWQWHAMAVNGAAPDWSFIPTYRRFTDNAHWYFGALSMRQNPAHWLTLGHRIVFEVTGLVGLALALIGVWVSAVERRWDLFWWLGGVALGMVVFFNLNVMHNYYQVPLVGLASVAMAVGILHIANLIPAPWKIQSGALLILLLIVGAECVTWSERNYYTIAEPMRSAGLAIGTVVPEGELVVVSLGGLDPRSPHLLYRARRYGWSIPDRDLNPILIDRLEGLGARWLAVVDSEPPLDALGPSLTGVPWRAINLPGGRSRLFVYHLAGRQPPLSRNGFEDGMLDQWSGER